MLSRQEFLQNNVINQVCMVFGKQAGSCEVWLQKRLGANPEMVKTYSAGDSFGELALLYDAPRAATVKVRLSLFLFPLTLYLATHTTHLILKGSPAWCIASKH